MQKEFEDRADATLRQAFELDGAFMKEVANIIKAYPNWSARFVDKHGRIDINLVSNGGATREEANKIYQAVEEAFARYNKLPGVPGIGDAFHGSIEEREREEDE